ncbi:MAG TPA: GNAT family N-acetyltransferase [Longimicrobiales bacterium]
MTHVRDGMEPGDATGAAATTVDVRPLRTHEDFAACVELQRLTWGGDYTDIVPASLLKVVPKVGGVVAGAFGGDGRMLGFVFGVTGIRGGRVAHWSHMLAVRPEARNLGIGRRLKEYQREMAAKLGAEAIYWTFDPLIARNAHLNLTRLGAEVVEYSPDMYGRTGSDLHVLGTDRLVVVWRIAEGAPAGARAVAPVGVDAAPIVNRGPGGEPLADTAVFAEHPLVRIEVPADIEGVRASSMDLAMRWREAIRRAFSWYLGRGYRVVGFSRELEAGRCHYALAAPGAAGVDA